MRKIIGAIVAALALLALQVWPASADEAKTCHLYRLAQFDMSTDVSGRVSVPMTINGKTVSLLIDTGGSISTLSQLTASFLGVDVRVSRGFREQYYGGEVMDRYTIVHDAEFGGIKGPELAFFIMSNRRVSADEDGTLSPDIMRQFDVDFDFANAQFNLFSPDHCEGQVVYWTQGPYAAIQVESDRDHHLRVPLQIDGQRITADIDTGATESVGSLDDIEDDFSLRPDNPALKLLPNEDEHSHRYRYPFKVLSFGGVAVYNPSITLYPDSESKTRHKFLIGMNVLRHLHMYIAYREQVLYVTPATAH
jgi:predicted aspartyl protease